MHITRILAVN